MIVGLFHPGPWKLPPLEWHAVIAIGACEDHRPVSILKLSKRAMNGLQAGQVTTIGELCRCSAKGLRKVRGIGRTTTRELERKLNDIGLFLSQEQTHELPIGY